MQYNPRLKNASWKTKLDFFRICILFSLHSFLSWFVWYLLFFSAYILTCISPVWQHLSALQPRAASPRVDVSLVGWPGNVSSTNWFCLPCSYGDSGYSLSPFPNCQFLENIKECNLSFQLLSSSWIKNRARKMHELKKINPQLQF